MEHTVNISSAEEKALDRTLYVKLPTWRKLSYSGIEMGNQFIWTMISSFLMIYLTDTFLIPIGMVSMLFVVCKFWDAVNDPIVGMLADRTRTRWGRYRPWIIFGTVPMFVIGCLLFWPHPDWPMSAKLLYVYTLYFVLVLIYTCVNMTNGSLASVMTQDPAERGSIATWRSVSAFMGGTAVLILISIFEPTVSAAFPNMGYFLITLGLALIGIPLQLFGALSQKEIVPPPEQRNIPLSTLLKASSKNTEYIKVSAMFFLYGLSWYGVLSVEYYWFIYVVKDGPFYAACCIFGLIPTVLSGPIAPWLANRFRSKAKAAIVAFGVFSAVNFGSYFLFDHTMNHALINLALALMTLGICVGSSMLYGLIPDTVEYSELLSDGIRMDGFLNTMVSFWSKVGITVGTAATGWVLEAAGYIPNLAVQSQSTITALNVLRWIMPGVAGLLIVLICLTYRIDYTRFDEIVTALQNKKARAAD